jgi:hypothetical protein
MGIMNVEDYLKTAYYFTDAKGPDSELWEDATQVVPSVDYTLDGYFPRVKKINEAILPINEELIGLNQDLLEKRAKLTVEEATYEASVSGIE